MEFEGDDTMAMYVLPYRSVPQPSKLSPTVQTIYLAIVAK